MDLEVEANAIGLLLLTLSDGGSLLVSPSDLETISEYDTNTRPKKRLRAVVTPQMEKGWSVTNTVEEIITQIKRIYESSGTDVEE